MNLTHVHVTNFRSVEDSGEFEVGQVLCLVGKNEAGKTAVIQALAGLNPHPSTPFSYDLERDYPRQHLTQYASRHKGKEAVVVKTTWELTQEEKGAIIEKAGEKALLDKPLVIKRSYGDKEPEWELPINFKHAVEHLIEDERLNAVEKKPLSACANTQELRKALQNLDEPTEKHKRLLQRIDGFPEKTITGLVKSVLEDGFPQFMLFSHYDRMVGQLRVDTYDARNRGRQGPPIEAGEQVFLDFLEFAGTSVAEITAASTYEGLNARCESASNRITQQLLEYWTQNPYLEIEVRVTKAESNDLPPFNEGIIARARVKNNLHKVTVPFSERSAGFIWFFSFLVKFAQVQKGGGKLVLLLDEPGLTLHGKAQGDLLRYFVEKLAPEHQVIFTTHSPFMVPANDLPSVRIVEDRITSPRPNFWVSEGTKVRDDTLVTDRDTLFPLQGALGYELTQTLFVGKYTLLLEGPGDILYLQALSSALEKGGTSRLDPRWTLCPAGGIDKIQPFVALFSGQKLDIAALTDYAKTDRKRMETLRQNRVLESDRLMTFASLLGVDEADVEDIFTPAFFAEVLNGAFSLPDEHKLDGEKLLQADGNTTRLLKKAEAYFRILPPEIPEFDHFTPAAWLFRNPSLFDGNDKGTTETLSRAEKVVAALNRLLAHSRADAQSG